MDFARRYNVIEFGNIMGTVNAKYDYNLFCENIKRLLPIFYG